MEILVLAIFALGIGGALGWFDSGDDNPGQPERPDDPDGEIFNGTADDDVIIAGNGDDTINAGAGDDQVYGKQGDDVILLGAGNDSTVPADGAPYFGQAGDDVIRGYSGNDEIFDGMGANDLYGDTGADIIVGLDLLAGATEASGADQLFGGFGSDVLVGDEGDDLYGGAKDDVFVVLVHPNSDAPVDIMDFDESEDAGISLVLSDTTDASAVDDLSQTTDIDGRITQAVTAAGVMLSLDGNDVALVHGATAEIAEEKLALVLALTAPVPA